MTEAPCDNCGYVSAGHTCCPPDPEPNLDDKGIADALKLDGLPFGFTASYEYPGYIAIRHDAITVEIVVCSDFERKGTLDVQVQSCDGSTSYDAGDRYHWPEHSRTLSHFVSLVTPTLVEFRP